MTSQEEIKGPTPAGGVRAVAYYTDDAGLPCAKDRAASVEIVEFDRAGKVLARTYGTVSLLVLENKRG